ncbi:MAG TPA: DNA-binding protein [Halobacteriales archaeon]|nr:DNA-binding protein [Halobacteriales archaeon]
MSESRLIPPDAFDLPAGEEPAARCPYCERPFRAERSRDLHVGEAHLAGASEVEVDRYEAAREAEEDDLFVFHLKIVAAIVVVIMGYVYLYGFVLS